MTFGNTDQYYNTADEPANSLGTENAQHTNGNGPFGHDDGGRDEGPERCTQPEHDGCAHGAARAEKRYEQRARA
jgi:hypothetical protein